jgi:hypothetical protein
MKDYHVGRHWSGNHMERLCPCPLEPCGLVDSAKADPKCTQHSFSGAKTMRQIHAADDCARFKHEHNVPAKYTKDEWQSQVLRSEAQAVPA